MDDERIRIEAPPETLEQIRRELEQELGDAVTVEAVSAAVPGELREPEVVAILVALSPTAVVAIQTAGAVIQRHMTHLERKELLRIYREQSKEEIEVEQLTGAEPER